MVNIDVVSSIVPDIHLGSLDVSLQIRKVTMFIEGLIFPYIVPKSYT
jgi:hypothetical protein